VLSKVRVYGRIAKFLKRRSFDAAVSSAAEAVRFLLANFPHLEPELAQGHYRISVGTYDLSEEELSHPTGQQEIKIIPVVAGAGATGRIITGVALIALAFASGAGVFGAAFAKNIGLFGVISGVGTTLVLGGVSQLLTPVPTLPTGADSNQDPRKSYSFSGIQQTSRAGVPVPICYGEVLTGSVVISAGIETVQSIADSPPVEVQIMQALFKQG
jgi:predicted phage tail protein